MAELVTFEVEIAFAAQGVDKETDYTIYLKSD